ncbi:LPXTG cell wall anchor domain-containing protein [Actinomyces vulturis]|uniref:LPXTG cell wall anchor domain-containing protein n=1 Tax=Actinomyces vulturis TaxID=1857645 RepID=UPI000836FC65|nr:LPXTG cell wall anchor domain-containing protein [Actinomyces vulturis]
MTKFNKRLGVSAVTAALLCAGAVVPTASAAGDYTYSCDSLGNAVFSVNGSENLGIVTPDGERLSGQSVTIGEATNMSVDVYVQNDGKWSGPESVSLSCAQPAVETETPAAPETPAEETPAATQPVVDPNLKNPYGDEAEKVVTPVTEDVKAPVIEGLSGDEAAIAGAMVSVGNTQTGPSGDQRVAVTFKALQNHKVTYIITDNNGNRVASDVVLEAGAADKVLYFDANTALNVKMIRGEGQASSQSEFVVNVDRTVKQPVYKEEALPTFADFADEATEAQVKAMVKVADKKVSEKGEVRYPVTFESSKNFDVVYTLINKATGEVATVYTAKAGSDAHTQYFDPGQYELKIEKVGGEVLEASLNLGATVKVPVVKTSYVMPADAIIVDPAYKVTGVCVNGVEKISVDVRQDEMIDVLHYGIGTLNDEGKLINANAQKMKELPVTVDRPEGDAWMGVVIDVENAKLLNPKYGDKLYFANGTRAAMFPLSDIALACSTPEAPADEATEAPAPADEATEAPVLVDEATEAPAPADEATEAPVLVDEATEAPAPADEATEAPAPADEAKPGDSKAKDEAKAESTKKPAKKSDSKKGLAQTGADALSLLGIAGVAAVAGAGALTARRRHS